MVSVKVFEPEDLEGAEWVWSYPSIRDDLSFWMKDQHVAMRSMYRDDVFLGVAGVRLMRRGVGELFMFPTTAFHRNPIAGVKAVIHLMMQAKEAYDLHRFQLTIEESYEDGHRWASFLGFEKEGLMKAYDTLKENHWMYGRVF